MVNTVLKTLQKSSWKSIWAGNWGLLDCSDWGKFYTRSLKIKGELFLHKVIFIYKEGRVSTWVKEDDLKRFSLHLAKVAMRNRSIIKEKCQGLKKQTDLALLFMKENAGTVDERVYKRYLKVVRSYYAFHIFIKYIVDALPKDFLKKTFTYLEEARIYAEPVFSAVINFDNRFAENLGKKLKIKPEYILVTTQEEIGDYFTKGIMPDKKELRQRWVESALVIDRRRLVVYKGQDAQKIAKAILPSLESSSFRGQTGFGGKASGTVRIVFDPSRVGSFEKGDILVASMTRPEYVPLMKKAGAIVTDAGGILCHAAITARELKIPCVIGTKIATQVLKDGDMVEVDAEKGIVKKL